MRRGFSMVELAIAFVILGLALLPVIQLFTSASQQARQTADHSLAVSLQSKVDEDLRLENWENPHLVDAVASAPPGPAAVVGGASPFFVTLEDDAQPYGLILPGVDPPIAANASALARELASYDVQLTPSPLRTVGTAGQVQDLQVAVGWKDFQQVRRQLTVLTVLGRYGAVTAPDLVPVDRAGADDAIRRVFYPAGSDLASAAGGAGADLATIRAVGDITLISAARSALSTVYERDVGALEVIATDGDALAQARRWIAVGRRHEAQVAGILEAMRYMTPPLRQLANYQPAAMGTPPPARVAYRTGVTYAGWQMFELADAIVKASTAYARACEPPLGAALPGRVRTRVVFKLLELAKLQSLTCGPNDTAYILILLSNFAASQDGRNPNFLRFARAELNACRDIAALTASYPAKWRAAIWNDYKAAALPAIPKVLSAP